MIRTVIPSLLLIGSAGIAAAADDLTTDERLSIGLSPGVTSHELSGGVSQTADTDSNSGIQIEPGVFWTWHHLMDQPALGLVAGPSIFYRSSTGDNQTNLGGGETKIMAYGIKLAAGPTYSWEQFHFELTPFIGLGTSKMEINNTTGNSKSENGTLIDYGITVGGYYDITKELFAGLQVGYDHFTTDVTFKNVAAAGGADVDDTATGSGMLLLATGGWRF